MERPTKIDPRGIRQRLAGLRGGEYWRSLEELADTEAFQEYLHREFPSQASEFTDPVGRRRFLKLMGASLALAGLTGCTRQPQEAIVPYVRPPEELVPGKPVFVATAMTLNGQGMGLVVENHLGRPTKVEGNPQHPASLGGTDPFAQASVLTLCDPDRSPAVLSNGDIASWASFLTVARAAAERLRGQNGRGFRILTESVTSPTLVAQIEALLAAFPGARWHRYELGARDSGLRGAELAFGEQVQPVYRFDQAEVVVALDSDFLCDGPASVRYSSDFAQRRRVRAGTTEMNRLYAIESTPGNTGALADHRLPLKASEIAALARALAASLGVPGIARPEPLPESLGRPHVEAFLAALVADLGEHRGRSLIVPGEYQAPEVHALAHLMNAALGNVGNTVYFTEPVEPGAPFQLASLVDLVQAMDAGEVDVLLVLGGNPVYSAPADLDFAGKLAKVNLRIHLSLYVDETSRLCQWHLPQAHFLESWGDTRAYNGVVTICQPLIEPLYGGRSALEVVAAFSERPSRSAHDMVKEYWRSRYVPGGEPPVDLRAPRVERALPPAAPGAAAPPPSAAAGLAGEPRQPAAGQAPVEADGFERFWRTVLHEGVMPGTELPARNVQPVPSLPAAPLEPVEGLELIFRPDPSVYDGRFANNAWLQELPKPLTKLTWDNAVLLAPLTAAALDVGTGDLVELLYRGRTVTGPVFVLPGHPADAVTVHLGYGRQAAGRVGDGAGFNANAIRTADAPWAGSGLRVVKIAGEYPLATTQHHHLMHGRDFVRAASFDLFLEHPDFASAGHGHGHEQPSLYPEWKYAGNQWGMVIDNTVCTGCNACVVACQSENNIPVVGKDGVLMNREMHWLRVDHYYHGEMENPRSFFQPVPCMHCEKAPCEVVCPVAATVHDSQGLNEMIYNRCVGTRYCSNNCPYKVRRFNFFDYGRAEQTPSLKLLMNPDVTVRTRGVMEKCTYCIQRISHAGIEAKKEGREIRDGEVVTACQGACPTQAIVFGQINEPTTLVSQLKRQPHNYSLLGELNTQPRTTYLAALRNLNPVLDSSLTRGEEEGGEHGGT